MLFWLNLAPFQTGKNLKEIRTTAAGVLEVLPEGKPALTEKTWRALEELFDLVPSPFPGSK